MDVYIKYEKHTGMTYTKVTPTCTLVHTSGGRARIWDYFNDIHDIKFTTKNNNKKTPH